MSKKVIINESVLDQLLIEQIINEADLSKSDIDKMIKDALKSNGDVNKDIEKKVKALVAKTLTSFFKTLWQRHGFYETEIMK